MSFFLIFFANMQSSFGDFILLPLQLLHSHGRKPTSADPSLKNQWVKLAFENLVSLWKFLGLDSCAGKEIWCPAPSAGTTFQPLPCTKDKTVPALFSNTRPGPALWRSIPVSKEKPWEGQQISFANSFLMKSRFFPAYFMAVSEISL